MKGRRKVAKITGRRMRFEESVEGVVGTQGADRGASRGAAERPYQPTVVSSVRSTTLANSCHQLNLVSTVQYN